MTLNKYSYCHKNIRLLCYQLEQKTQLQMKTNLDAEFEQLIFKNNLQYIMIDWKTYTIATLSYKLSNKEIQIIEDIILYLDWLETGKRFEKELEKSKAVEPKKMKVRKRKKVATKRKNKKVA